jgi:hypothetical protein
VEPTGAVGHGPPQDRGALGDQGLCSFGFPPSFKVRSPLPLHHEPTGALVERGERDEPEWWRWSVAKVLWKNFYLGFGLAG